MKSVLLCVRKGSTRVEEVGRKDLALEKKINPPKLRLPE